MKKKYVQIIAVTIIIALAIYVYLGISENEKEFTQFAMLYREQAAEYLNDKYYENMIVMDDWTYYDSVISYTAYPENNPNYEFRVSCVTKEVPEFLDYYLTSYLETEMGEIMKPIVDEHFVDATCYAIVKGSDDILQNYYNSHQKPLSWNDTEHLDELYAIVIKLSEDVEGPIDEADLLSLKDDIQNKEAELDIDIKDIVVFIRDNKKEKDYKQRIVY